MKVHALQIPVDGVRLEGDLSIPDHPIGLVIFSHGSGSSRLSPRNRMVAEYLRKNRMATLLFDLLTPLEDEEYSNRFDIGLLTDRLVAVTRWVVRMPELKGLPVGYFGASTGAASALRAAARLGTSIVAVVSRGGRPDLAMEVLDRVTAPTLLLVGELDAGVIELNETAYHALQVEKHLEIVPGATHLFGETGKLEEVAALAADWFRAKFHVAGKQRITP